MNLLFSCIGKRGYIAEFFRAELQPKDRIIGTSNTPWTPGFASCDEGLILPPIASDEYVPALEEVCRNHDIQGILSFFDPDVHRISCHYDRFLSLGVLPVLPRAVAADIANDKMRTHGFLGGLGFNVPMTTDSLAAAFEWLAACKWSFPLVVKPRCGFGSENTFVARSKLELEIYYSIAEGQIIQAFIEGTALNIDGLGDLTARAVAVVPWRKLLSKQGETERAETIEMPTLLELGSRLIESVGIIGPVDVDFIQDGKGMIWVLELNARFGGGYPVSHLAGADYPRMILDMLAGRDLVPRIGEYRRGVTMMKQLRIIPGPAGGLV